MEGLHIIDLVVYCKQKTQLPPENIINKFTEFLDDPKSRNLHFFELWNSNHIFAFLAIIKGYKVTIINDNPFNKACFLKTVSDQSIDISKVEYKLCPLKDNISSEYDDEAFIIIENPFTFMDIPKNILYKTSLVKKDDFKNVPIDISVLRFLVKCCENNLKINDLSNMITIHDLESYISKMINNVNNHIDLNKYYYWIYR